MGRQCSNLFAGKSMHTGSQEAAAHTACGVSHLRRTTLGRQCHGRRICGSCCPGYPAYSSRPSFYAPVPTPASDKRPSCSLQGVAQRFIACMPHKCRAYMIGYLLRDRSANCRSENGMWMRQQGRGSAVLTSAREWSSIPARPASLSLSSLLPPACLPPAPFICRGTS